MELQLELRAPVVEASPQLGNVLSAETVGKFSWVFWWLYFEFQVIGIMGLQRQGTGTRENSAKSRSVKQSAPGNWWSAVSGNNAEGGRRWVGDCGVGGAGQDSTHSMSHTW